ncbi:AAA family ATPase [Emticicia sp. 21SJ11W-3]|uniref:AAA family ATPase n=1 Tax=Emticicia sp. 21SJ11W-3 TaxID=2916755 RepID=UPI0020A05A40|nr:AAA family ATPase [Emticicia sp. 21SJ11W-3]UTA69204.1 adenylate kinase [Emticicia sp. 21SJ11W-3]
MKLHLMGASGSGVTTLGKALAETLDIPYFDSDEYFWEKTTPPFISKRQPDVRNAMILSDVNNHKSWVLGGSLLKWNIEVDFDLIVFLYIPNEIRMARLKKREYARYGDVISADEDRKRQYLEFMAWAAGYDDNSTQGRNLASHESWLKTQTCPVFELRGDLTVSERLNAVINKIAELNLKLIC